MVSSLLILVFRLVLAVSFFNFITLSTNIVSYQHARTRQLRCMARHLERLGSIQESGHQLDNRWRGVDCEQRIVHLIKAF
jgi:hypothetical protein